MSSECILPRIIICTVILSSTIKWDFEPTALSGNNCYHIYMESIGKYWIPIFNYLENDIAACLIHMKYVKTIKGKKTDKKIPTGLPTSIRLT